MKTFLILLVATLTPLLAPHARANGVGNGGDWVVAEFVARGYVVAKHFETAEPDELVLTSDEVDALFAALQSTRVESLDEPLFDAQGVRVDARQLPDPLRQGGALIQLDRERWLGYLSSGVDTYRLVFHEYLWTLGKDDRNYRLSGRIRLRPEERLENQPAPTSLPSVTYSGWGGWRNSLGQTASYNVTTTFADGWVSNWYSSSPGTGLLLAWELKFGEGGFFTIHVPSVAAPLGYGYCNAIQCVYSLTAAGATTSETLTFLGERLYRVGWRVEGALVTGWQETLTRRAP